jgi:hypothetical protein
MLDTLGDFMGHTCKAPKIKPAAEYLLMCLAEECAEVTQIASKTFRFGQHDTQPGRSDYNCTRLAYEIGDVLGIVDMLRECGIVIDEEIIAEARASKKRRLMEFIDRPRKP